MYFLSQQETSGPIREGLSLLVWLAFGAGFLVLAIAALLAIGFLWRQEIGIRLTFLYSWIKEKFKY